MQLSRQKEMIEWGAGGRHIANLEDVISLNGL